MSDHVTLYEVETGLMEALELAEETDPGSEDEKALTEVLTAYINGAMEKRDRVARFLRHLDAQEDFAAAEIRRLQDRKRVIENRKKRLKEQVVFVMNALGVKKLEGETCTLSLRKTSARVVIPDESRVPASFKTRTETWTVDKRAVKEEIVRRDQEYEGPFDWAYLEAGETVVVK